MCYGTKNSVFHTVCTKDHFLCIFYYSMQLSICTMNCVLKWPVFVLPQGLSWMGLFCTMLWLLSCFYLFTLQLSSLCHLGEVSFIWTYLCGNKVDHNHLLLIFCIFCMWALTSICPAVPFCQSLHIKIYFIGLSPLFRITVLIKPLEHSRVTVQKLCCSLISNSNFFLLLYSKVLVSFFYISFYSLICSVLNFIFKSKLKIQFS